MAQLVITESAQAHFRKLLANQETDTQIRVFVSNPGTSQAECGVSYSPAEDREEKDTEISFEGFIARISAHHLSYLDDALIDYESNALGGQLTLKAPNARTRKIANDAPLIDRIQYLLETEVNPNLASHGGFVRLVEVTDEMVAILEFGGGCQGCGMADVTLKQGVERTLLERLPELTGAKDITDHQSGANPYFK
jgi:Fe/S biogenesis protein NfuA